MQQTVQQMGGEKDGEIQELQERTEALQQHIENICQQHEEVLLRAENDKQQALLLGKQADVSVLFHEESLLCVLYMECIIGIYFNS
jgi:rootletin